MANELYNLFGKKVSQTYHSLLQSGSDGKFYDGDGNEVTINATIPDIYVKYSQTGSFATTGSNIFRGDQTVTGSLFTTGSNTLIGSTTLTGSLNVSGSTVQVGNNSLLGNTTLSGSIIISGAFGTNNPTVQIYGDTTHNGYLRFDPVSTNIDSSISASYIYVSGSTNDLYFTQNGNGYANTTRLRWLEGNLYTGLLNGGLISASVGGTTFNISSGSGIIVNLNASLSTNPYPTITYVNWGNFTNQSLTYRTTAIQTYVGIDSNGNIIQQTNPWNDGQYNESISLGTVIHQNQSTVNATITYPNVAYGYKQRTYDFIKAFGPLKLSGYTLSTSSSLGLTVGSGNAFADGRNYQNDPNNPSYITDAGTTVSKIFRYYQSGSSFVQDTNAAAGYTEIDTTLYNPNGAGILTNVSPSKFYVHRIFWYPNSATKGIVDYYGLNEYATIDEAQANFTNEPFLETPNTQQNAIFLGIVIIKGNSNFNSANDYRVVQASLFRAAGLGGGGTGGTGTPGGSDTQIQYNNNGVFGGVPNLTWDGTTLSATGSFTGSFTGSLQGTGSWAVSASQALSSSFAQTSITSSYPISATGTTLVSVLPGGASSGNNNSIFLGASAGSGVTSAYNSNFLGYLAGQLATNAYQSNFLGAGAGLEATRAENSNFFGLFAGQKAVSASFSTLIGYQAGANPDGTATIGTNNIIIGNNITLPANTRNSINLGGIIFATGSYSTLGGNPYSGSQFNVGRVGINIVTPQYTLDVSGSGNYSNGLTVTGSVIGTSFTGSSFTGSFTGSFNGVVLTSQTSSMLDPYVLNSQTSSFVTNSQTGSFTRLATGSVTASVTPTQFSVISGSSTEFTVTGTGVTLGNIITDIHRITGSLNTSGSITAVSFTGSISGSLTGTGSWAVSASQAITASYVLNAVSSSFATTASFASNGGVTQIVAGTNITITNGGSGSVTINSTGGGGSSGAGANVTASFTNQSTWTFTHGLNNRGVVLQTYDTNWNQLIPQDITLTNANTATITFPTLESGFAIASLGGITTSSVSASFASTASFVNTLNQSVNITGDITASIVSATNNGNGTNFRVGDDAWIGDINTADTLQVRGQQNGGRGYIKFGTGSSNPIIGSSGTGVLEIQNGYIQMPSRPAFRVTGSTSSDITATTTLTLTQGVGVDYNQGNYYTASSGIFIAPVSGLYNVYLNARVGSAAASKQVIVYKNNTTPMLMWETTTNTGAVHFGVSGVIYLATNDNLRATVTVGNVQFDSNNSWGATYIG